MNILDELHQRFPTRTQAHKAALLALVLTAVLLAVGFVPAVPSLATTTTASLAAVLAVAAGVLIGRDNTYLARSRYARHARRWTALGAIAGWVVVSTITTREDILTDHLRGALMVFAVLGAVAFASSTPGERAADATQREAEQAQADEFEDIFDQYDGSDETIGEDTVDDLRPHDGRQG